MQHRLSEVAEILWDSYKVDTLIFYDQGMKEETNGNQNLSMSLIVFEHTR